VSVGTWAEDVDRRVRVALAEGDCPLDAEDMIQVQIASTMSGCSCRSWICTDRLQASMRRPPSDIPGTKLRSGPGT
jgi:hypothetical protein